MSVADKKLAKKVSIINAAYELFTRSGVNMTAIDDVVEKAGVAKGTFYLYFKNKYDLLDQIIISKSEIIFQNVFDKIKDSLENSEISPFDKIFAFVDCTIDYLSENKNLVILIQKNTSVFSFLWFSKDNTKLNENFKKLSKLFSECCNPADDVTKKIYIITSAILSICCDSILYEKPYTIEEIRPHIHSMITSILVK